MFTLNFIPQDVKASVSSRQLLAMSKVTDNVCVFCILEKTNK